MTINVVLNEERIVDGARLVFLSAETELAAGEVEMVIPSARIKKPARFVVVTPFVGDTVALIATSVARCSNGELRFRARADRAAKVRFDVLIRD